MLITCELRWFYRGRLPEEIEHWFAADVQGVHSQTPEEREDWYLLIPGCEHLSVKLRDRNLEIKWRVAQLGRVNFRDNLAGETEKWVKWTCLDPEAETVITPDVVEKGQWVSVKKVRSMVRFQVNPDNSLILVTEETKNDKCNVELTQLFIKEDSWWSLGFEASGKDANLTNNLEVVAKSVLNSYPADLQGENSYGYPKFLTAYPPKNLEGFLPQISTDEHR